MRQIQTESGVFKTDDADVGAYVGDVLTRFIAIAVLLFMLLQGVL